MTKTTDNPTSSVSDPVISEVRRHKREIAEEHGFDVIAMGRALQVRQNGDPRFVTLEGEQGADDQFTTAVDSKDSG